MNATLDTLPEPGAYGIEAVPAGTPDAMTCGTCGTSWAEDITPAGRCPWEHLHTRVLNCGHDSEPGKLGGGTGYAQDRNGYTFCYECAAQYDRNALHNGETIVAYAGKHLSPASVALTSWPGIVLGTARFHTSTLARKRYYDGEIDGIPVYGVGPAESGTYVTIHPRKGARR